VTNQLFDLALYQLVQANLKLGDERAAGQAVEKILAWFPVSGYGEQGLLLLGEKASEQKINPQMARRSFQQVLEKNPETPLWPEIQLAIARSYEQEGDWTNVSSTYASIEGSPGFATNTRRAQVEFCHALACDKEGMESNALERMSNVVIRFPGDTNAAYAQNWIGNYHLNHGNYVEADIAFQELWNPKKFPAAGELAWQARLMAGLAAFKHLDFAGARNDFQYVVSDTNAPAALLEQAQFQLGYTVFQQFEHAQTNGPLLTFAIDALSKVTNAGPTNPLAALAYGQLGNCQLAWAQLSPTNASAYASAIQMYQAVLLDTNDAPGDVAARSQAEVGLGLVAQRQNQTNEALMHFGNVLYDVDTRHADPAWVKEAGVRAAALYEEQKDWPHAMDVYRRVQEVIPPLGAEMQTNIDRLKAAALPK
jgi:tetratricopeptide (TPR) repeat protein